MHHFFKLRAVFYALLASVLFAFAAPLVSDGLYIQAFRGIATAASPLMIHTHSHNDYAQNHPLLDALDNRFYSVEADIWLHDGKIFVSHIPFFYKGTLKELYLDPLQKLVQKRGSVYGDDKPFYLWLDIKDGSHELRQKLAALLNRYPALSVFTDHGVARRPITIILTGDENSKEKLTNQSGQRELCRDSNDFSPNDPPADWRWRWYSLKWSDYFQWDGEGTMPKAQEKKFLALVEMIHEKGRKVRFWATPETTAFWTEALKARVDLIGTDALGRLERFLASIFPPKLSPAKETSPRPQSVF